MGALSSQTAPSDILTTRALCDNIIEFFTHTIQSQYHYKLVVCVVENQRYLRVQYKLFAFYDHCIWTHNHLKPLQ